MEGFMECVVRHAADHRISDETISAVRDLYDDLTDDFGRSMGRDAAEALAEKRALEILQRQVKERKRRALLQQKAWSRISADLENYKRASGQDDKGDALLALLDRDEVAQYSSVTSRRQAILGFAHARMDQVLATFRRNIFGQNREPAQMSAVVREIFGQDTGDQAAKEMARAWSDAADMLRQRFNAAGGSIPKRQDWGLPQTHDSLKVRQVGFEEWRDFLLPKLDVGRMLDETTGQPIPANRLDTALRHSWEKIRTDGFSALPPSGVARGRSVARRHTDHRFLVFKSADDWSTYMDRFGTGNAFDVMLSHLDTMARETAALEVLGPNPRATLTYLGQVLEREAAAIDAGTGGTGAMDKARRRIKAAEDMWGFFTGSHNAPIDGAIARSFAGTRNVLTAAKLGSASLTAITDFNFQRIAARMTGLRTTRIMSEYLSLMTPGNLDDRRLAVRLGLIADSWSQIASAQQRYVGEVTGPEIAQRVSNFVMDVSLLSPHTQAGRWAFGMEFTGMLADLQGRNWSELPEVLRRTMGRYGIHAGDWALMRQAPLYEHHGASFLRPEDVIHAGEAGVADRAIAEQIGTKLLEMIQGETEFAVPTASLRGKAAFIGDNRPGTFQGELLRSAMMYKNFSITLFLKQSQRILSIKGGKARGVYAADLLITTALVGGLVIQLKEISKGRDPRPMVGEKGAEFWGAAFLQGGGLGIFGDFLFADVNRFGGGLAQTIAGPVVQFADDLRRLTVGNVLQLPGERPTHFGAELVNFLRSNTPGGSIFYARLGLERLVLDQLQLAIDPQATRRFRRRVRAAERNFGNGYFWEPGAIAPKHAPDFTNLVGE